jgi:hypothetical protein
METKHTVAQLSDTNKASHILIENLESTTIFFRFTGLTETTRTVKDLQEGFEVDCSRIMLARIHQTLHPTQPAQPELDSAGQKKRRASSTMDQCKNARNSHTITTNRLLQIANLSQSWVLPASAQQIAEEVTSDTAGATAIEERERFLVVGRGLVFVSHDEKNPRKSERAKVC